VEVQEFITPKIMVTFISYQNMKFVFRDQTYGMHLKINGFDNCFLENIAFVNCNIGFIKILSSLCRPWYIELYWQNYVLSKSVYQLQYGIFNDSLQEVIIWCMGKFDGGQVALKQMVFIYIANCDFTNIVGDNVIYSSASLYNSNFIITLVLYQH
jgi:hypothetical protein